jgi:hypothetical protein
LTGNGNLLRLPAKIGAVLTGSADPVLTGTVRQGSPVDWAGRLRVLVESVLEHVASRGCAETNMADCDPGPALSDLYARTTDLAPPQLRFRISIV